MDSKMSNLIVDMNKTELKKLTKSQLINMLLKQDNCKKPVPTPRTKKLTTPIPTPRKNVSQMV